MSPETKPVHPGPGPAPVARRVREVNRVYVKAFRRNAHVLQAVYQARDEDERLKAQWDEVADHFQSRVTRAITEWQKAGKAYADLDPRHTAHALTLMVERVVMAWSYEGVEYDAEVLIDTLDKVWIRSLGLTSAATPDTDPAVRPTAE
ncbi:hypothetical protein [Actinomadura monticuli]|uniref:HTH-type transcriptional regulator EthR C-terminal domain-containing protein n=1 Tax=Actinomadura monticuli TaxID=3097367 RepID=A0ABV4Q6P8_9ACTN